jgi:hypothetical protein
MQVFQIVPKFSSLFEHLQNLGANVHKNLIIQTFF